MNSAYGRALPLLLLIERAAHGPHSVQPLLEAASDVLAVASRERPRHQDLVGEADEEDPQRCRDQINKSSWAKVRQGEPGQPRGDLPDFGDAERRQPQRGGYRDGESHDDQRGRELGGQPPRQQ